MADIDHPSYRSGIVSALNDVAQLAEDAGKKRSAEWLRECAQDPMGDWPAAPAYKGPVVLVNDPEPGLKALTAAELAKLREAVRIEHNERFLKGGE